MQNLKPFINSLQNFAQKRLQFQEPPKLFLKQDQENAQNVFGKTAYYDPNEKSITLFTTGRHPKDILRSFAHELVHHCQNLRGDLSPDKFGEMGIDYAQQNKHMREMEREAYEKGNLCFRDWEDGIKVSMQQKNNQLKENKKMVKISKKDLKGLIGKILEARLGEKVVKDKEAAAHNQKAKDKEKAHKKAEMAKEKKGLEAALAKQRARRVRENEDIEEGAFSDSHYCIHHGGVDHNGSIAMAEAIQHVAPDENGFISHYDMKLEDGTILENVAAEDIQVTNASLAEAHHKRDTHAAYKKDDDIDESTCGKRDEEDLEEGDIPQGLKDYMASKKKSSNDNENSEKDSEDKPSEKTGKMPMKDEPEGKDLNKDGKKGHGKVPAFLKNESKIQTPEQEKTLYESRFNKRNEEIFDKLKKLWTK